MNTHVRPPAASRQELIRQLPYPMILFENGVDASFANDRFLEVFLPGQLEGIELRQSPHSDNRWHKLDLRRRDGVEASARALAIDVSHGLLLVVEDAEQPQSQEEFERLQQRIMELENLSATDRLTGAWNRMHLERVVGMEMSRAGRTGLPVTLVLLDIDHFKRVNDVHGHLVGDDVLKEFVVRIRRRMRSADLLFRWGGEEFVVLAAGIGYRGGATLAESLREAIAGAPFATAGSLTASLGVAEFVDSEDAESWFRRTDQALYAAKAGGRDRVHVDRRGNSDIDAEKAGVGVLRLDWREAYECGEATIDADHREIFALGNALISAVIRKDSAPAALAVALDTLLTHVAGHFRHEEEVLERHGYGGLAAHRRAHVLLLHRAAEMKAAIDGDQDALGKLVDFLVRDVITGHLFNVDRQFFPLFQNASGVAGAVVGVPAVPGA